MSGAGIAVSYEYNGLGSMRQMVEASGNVTMGRNYEPYGGVLSSIAGGFAVAAFFAARPASR